MSWLFLLACSVPDAPETLEELMVYGFVSFEERDLDLQAFAAGTIPLVDELHDELVEGYVVDTLSNEDLEAVGVEAPAADEVLGVAAVTEPNVTPEQVAEAMSYPDMTEVFPTTLEYTLHEHTDRSCFLSQECSTYTWEATRTVDGGFFGKTTQRFTSSLRRVGTLDEDVIVLRTLVPEESHNTSGLFKIRQQYAVSLIYRHQGQTHRMEAIWVDAEIIGLDLPKSLALDAAVNSMHQAADDIDAWFASQ